nr:retrovirus-related Pol polyprotein from transposon TNT 1-94 [Tanacetum cinerariifolium]
MRKLEGEWIMKKKIRMISKDGTISKFPGYTSSKEEADEEEEEEEEKEESKKKGSKEALEVGSNTEHPGYAAIDNEVESDLESTARSEPKCKEVEDTCESKNKGLIAETYDWDNDEVSSDENEVTKVKALMALIDEERVSVGKESARNRDWTKISMKEVHTLLEMEDNDDRKSFLDYLYIDLNYVKEQRNNLLSKYRNLVQELTTCKEHLLVLKQSKLDLLTM